jgi:hypothetical protein
MDCIATKVMMDSYRSDRAPSIPYLIRSIRLSHGLGSHWLVIALTVFAIHFALQLMYGFVTHASCFSWSSSSGIYIFQQNSLLSSSIRSVSLLFLPYCLSNPLLLVLFLSNQFVLYLLACLQGWEKKSVKVCRSTVLKTLLMTLFISQEALYIYTRKRRDKKKATMWCMITLLI